MANLKTNISGGGKQLQIGDITQEDKSGDSNFIKCNGDIVPQSNSLYNTLSQFMTPNTLGNTNVSTLSNFSEVQIAIIYYKGLFITSGSTTSYTSDNEGTTFVSRGTVKNTTKFRIIDGILFSMGGTGIKRSTDGLTWQTVSTYSCNDMTFGMGKYVAYGSYILNSLDGITWTSVGSGNSYLLNIVANDTYFLAGISKYDSNARYFQYSLDGINFTATTLDSRNSQDLWVYNNTFYFSNAGRIKESIDGQNWSSTIDNTYSQDKCFICKLGSGYLTYSWNGNNTSYQKVGFSSGIQYTPTYGVYYAEPLSSTDNIYPQDATRMAISDKNVIFLFARYKFGLKFPLAYIIPNYINAYMKIS